MTDPSSSSHKESSTSRKKCLNALKNRIVYPEPVYLLITINKSSFFVGWVHKNYFLTATKQWFLKQYKNRYAFESNYFCGRANILFHFRIAGLSLWARFDGIVTKTIRFAEVAAAKFQIFRITARRTSPPRRGSGWQRYAGRIENVERSRGPSSDNEDDPLETPSFLRPDE